MPRDPDPYPLTGRFLEGRLRHVMTADEQDALEAMICGDEALESEQVVVARGEALEHSTLLVDGFMMRSITRNGHRAIVGLHVPGDFVDLHNYALKRIDHDIVAIGRVHVAYVRHQELSRLLKDQPRLARMLWFATLLDAAIHRTWIMKLEALPTERRIAHLFAELWSRLRMVGLARTDGFVTPLRQAHLAQMCGVSVIHASRALGALRQADIAEFRRGRVYVRNRAKLEAHGNFQADYLYGEGVLHIEPADLMV